MAFMLYRATVGRAPYRANEIAYIEADKSTVDAARAGAAAH